MFRQEDLSKRASGFELGALRSCAPFLRHLPLLHEGVTHVAGLPAELDEPSVVDDVVYDGGHLVVAECRSPPAELQVRGDHRRLPLVGVGEDLEEGPRAVPRRAAGHDVGPFEVVNQ